MKLGFVANSHGNLELLEAVVVMLIERHRVQHVVPVGTAVYDLDAVMRGRRQLFPVEVPWTSPSFPDFVLASVLHGMPRAPAAELERNERLAAAVVDEARAQQGFVMGPIEVGVVLPGHPSSAAPVLVRATPEHHGVETQGDRVYIAPGHLRGLDPGADPATCLLLEVAAPGVLGARFLDPEGGAIGEPVPIAVGP